MPRQLVLPAAGLSFTAALIHASVAPAHFSEYWGFGVFFIAVAALQLLWAGLVWHPGAGTGLLVLGAAGNLSVALVWLASRTVGLPVGPDAGAAEGVGLHDALASLDEIAIAVLVAVALSPTNREGRPCPLAAAAWVLAGVSFVGAFLGSHSAG